MRRTVLSALILTTLAAAASGQDLGNSLKVERLEFPVTVSVAAGAPDPCTIVGYLYYHGSFRQRPLQVVVHGATYNRTYWDFPRVNDRDYSYARYMAAPHRNYAVLAIDQLAAGESCRPANGLAVTLDETASALNQVIEQLRTPTNPTGYAFEQIVLVGHSAGSINATYVQARWHPADALVITGSRHLVQPPIPPGILAVIPYLGPLMSLPYFKLGLLDPTLRTALFYYPPGADATVIAADNATEDYWTGGQVGSTFLAFVYPMLFPFPLDGVHDVTGPVLVQLGDADALFPSGATDVEVAQWTNATVSVQELSGIGHSFNLHLNRLQSWEGIDTWLRVTLAQKP